MPIYEYQCSSCAKITEVIQKFSDDPLTECEKCGGKLERLLSAPGLHFKGSGWYVNDYAKSGKAGPNGDSGKKETTETKIAAKTEPASTTASKSA